LDSQCDHEVAMSDRRTFALWLAAAIVAVFLAVNIFRGLLGEGWNW